MFFYLLAVGVFISSCALSEDDGDEYRAAFVISASIENFGARNAIPSSMNLPSGSKVRALLEGMSSYGTKKDDDSGYTFLFMNFSPEKGRDYEIKISVLDDEDNDILVGNAYFKVTDESLNVTIPCVVMIPVENQGTGNVILRISHPKDSSVELSDLLFDVDTVDDTNSVIKGIDIPSGVHEVCILVKMASSEIYRLRERIYVYPDCITDKWGDSDSGELNISMMMRTEFYVMGKDSACSVFSGSSHKDSDGNEVSNGSIKHPFRSIQDAVDVIKMLNEASGIERVFTIYCDGTFEPVNDEKYCGKVVHLARTESEIGTENKMGFKNLCVRIIGIGSDKTVFDGMNLSGKDSPVVDVDCLSDVYMQNIIICRGNTIGFGGGIVTRGKLTLVSCEVSDNNASHLEAYPLQQRNGGGIYNCGSSLILRDSVVKNNKCKNWGSAIFCSDSSGNVELDGCNVSGNSSSQNNDSVVITESLTLKGSVEFGSTESIQFKNKVKIIAPSKLDEIEQVNIGLDGNMFVEGEKVLWGNSEDNFTKFKFEATTWGINSDGELFSLRVMLSTIGDTCPTSGYYWISVPEDWDKIRTWVDKSDNGLAGVDFMLSNDIDLGGSKFVPIGENAKPFRGKLDGNNKMIKGISITEKFGALFNYTGNGCEIRNLTVMGNATAAGIVHQATGTLIENCTNRVVVDSTSSGFAIGGIAGYLVSSTVRNCVNRESIKTNYYPAGGVIGKADRESEIDRIANYGIVYTSKDATNSYVGGLVGSLSCDLRNSCNYGSVSGQTYAGGIAGFILAYSNKGIKNCYNAGSVTSPYYGGGIVAQLHQDGVSNYEIANCYNIGQIGYGNGKQILSYVHTNFESKTGVIVKNNYSVSGMKYNGYAIEGVSEISVSSYPEIDQALDYDKDTMIVTSKSKSVVDLLNEWVDSNNAGGSIYSKWVDVTDGTSKICKFVWE